MRDHCIAHVYTLFAPQLPPPPRPQHQILRNTVFIFS